MSCWYTPSPPTFVSSRRTGGGRRSAACRLYTAIAEERQLLKQYHREELNPEVDWTYSMPWLFYNGAPPLTASALPPVHSSASPEMNAYMCGMILCSKFRY